MCNNEQVYCTNCKYFRLCDEQKPYCVSENVDKCDNWDCDDSRPFSERPYYEERCFTLKEIGRLEDTYGVKILDDTDYESLITKFLVVDMEGKTLFNAYTLVEVRRRLTSGIERCT